MTSKKYLSYHIKLHLFLVCLHYITFLNLWGDEAASMDLAELSIKQIFYNSDIHSPTYYLYLKVIVSIFGSSFADEKIIRLIHVMIFTVGIYFGWKTLLIIANKMKLNKI